MKPLNELKMQLESRSVNEGYARTAVSAFISQLDPTIEELNDIRTSVSEAVTNCIVHSMQFPSRLKVHTESLSWRMLRE